jgi:hypothetical protein
MSGSGITRTYGGAVDGADYPAPGARYYARRYQFGMGKPVLEMNPEEAKAEEVRRAKCYVREHPGTSLMQAVKLIREDDPILVQQARPLPHERVLVESQPARSYRHVQERAAHFVKTGQARSLREALKLACAEAPKIAEQAGAHASLMPDAEIGAAATYALLTGGQKPWQVKAHATDHLGQPLTRPPKLSDAEGKLKALNEADLVALLISKPGKGELHLWLPFLREWCRLTWPPVPVGTGRQGPGTPNDPYNREQERIWQRVRQERLRTRGFMD